MEGYRRSGPRPQVGMFLRIEGGYRKRSRSRGRCHAFSSPDVLRQTTPLTTEAGEHDRPPLRRARLLILPFLLTPVQAVPFGTFTHFYPCPGPVCDLFANDLNPLEGGGPGPPPNGWNTYIGSPPGEPYPGQNPPHFFPVSVNANGQ